MSNEEMNADNSSKPTPCSSRLGKCEVCAINAAKYTCPQCEVKTCSLPCVNIHKKELLCDGIRNRVKYVPLKKFTNMDLQSDYILLEETGRTVKRISLENRILNDNKRNFLRVLKLKKAARIRGIKLEFLPQKFTRHRNNSTFLNWKTGELFWKVQWIFPEANCTLADTRILDTSTLYQAVSKYISPDNTDDIIKKLKLYHSVGKNEIHILLKAEGVAGKKFYETDIENTISYNLRNKLILEHPIFYIILTENLKNYEIERSAPDVVVQDKYFKEINGNKNFLFSSTE